VRLAKPIKRRDYGRVPHSAPGEDQKSVILVVFPIVRLPRPKKGVILVMSPYCTWRGLKKRNFGRVPPSAPDKEQKWRDFCRVPHSDPAEAQRRRDFGRVSHSAPGDAQKRVIFFVFPIVRLARLKKA